MAGQDPVGFARPEQDCWQRLHSVSLELRRASAFAQPDAHKLSNDIDSLKAKLRTPEHTAKAGLGKEPIASHSQA
jgi:hypothetical protein